VNEFDFAPIIMRGTNSSLAGELGYAGSEPSYYWEHDFIHHWIADRKDEGPSEAIRSGDEHIPVEDAPLGIRYEEWLVHHIQSWIGRTDNPAFLLSCEGWDPQQAMDELRFDLGRTFGSLARLPRLVRRWSFNNALANLGYMNADEYDGPKWAPISSLASGLPTKLVEFECGEHATATRSFHRMPPIVGS